MKNKLLNQLKNKKICIYFLFFTISFPCLADSKPYFEAKQISPTLLDRPYDNDSQERKKELIEIKKIQKNVSKTDINEAAAEREFIPELIANKIDDRLSRHSFPKLYKLLDRATITSRFVVDNLKNHWQIVRPFLYDLKIKALIPQSSSYSYPSGHTVGADVHAGVMSLLIPERREEFMKLAQKIGWHRVQVGMHYQQDIEAGHKTALLIIGSLLENREFNKDFTAAKKELEEFGITR